MSANILLTQLQTGEDFRGTLFLSLKLVFFRFALVEGLKRATNRNNNIHSIKIYNLAMIDQSLPWLWLSTKHLSMTERVGLLVFLKLPVSVWVFLNYHILSCKSWHG